MEGTLTWIDSELDEYEREEIYRIKKVLEIKRKAEAQEEEDDAAAAAAPPPVALDSDGDDDEDAHLFD